MFVSFNYKYYFFKQDLDVTIFQLGTSLGYELPCFCYNELLTIAGNCRMCIVEVISSLKLVIACAAIVTSKMVIFTSSYRVVQARKGILEFLLSQHPLDCAVCDQASECDLQDLTVAFGSVRGRFFENYKRVVIDSVNSFVVMIMTRCIHCTRCVRFLNEITGSTLLGTIGRGSVTQIGTYINNNFGLDELSANIIDLCPVGALTSSVYSFVARSWELGVVYTYDILDSLGSDVIINTFNNKIVRILPRANMLLNEDWITNKTRFFFDSLSLNRFYYPQYFVENKGYIKIS